MAKSALVVAHFSICRASTYLSLIVGPFILLSSRLYYQPELLEKPLIVIVFGIAIPLLATLFFVVMRQLLFRNAAAIWVENGAIFYLNIYSIHAGFFFSSVRVSEVVSVEAGSIGWLKPVVVLLLADGKSRLVPTILLSESNLSVRKNLVAAVRRSA